MKGRIKGSDWPIYSTPLGVGVAILALREIVPTRRRSTTIRILMGRIGEWIDHAVIGPGRHFWKRLVLFVLPIPDSTSWILYSQGLAVCSLV